MEITSPKEAKTKINLDDLLTPTQFGVWMQLSTQEVLKKSKGRSAKLFGYWLNTRTVRFHPRAVLTKMARDAGASPEFIASMFAEIKKV